MLLRRFGQILGGAHCSQLRQTYIKSCYFANAAKTPLIQDLNLQYNQHAGIIDDIVKRNPTLNEPRIAVWSTFIATMKTYGFEESDAFKIISLDPQVLAIPNQELVDVLSRWHQCQLGSDYVKLLLLNNPSFIYVSLAIIERRLPILNNFAKKPKSLVLLLLRCPNVLTEQWSQVQAKIDYLTHVMRVEKSEILQSQALSKSLTHIKVRHGILLKCGLYETPSQYEHKRVKNEKSSFRNPHLKRIVDNEDISFARKICKLSFEEYEAYRDLVEEDDVQEVSEDELVSDSDTDSDSDDEKK